MVTENAPSNILFVHSLNRHRGSYLLDVLVNGMACEISTKPPQSKFLKTISGELLAVISECAVIFNFGKHRVQHIAWIVDIAEDCMIGNDFLKQHGCAIDFVNNKLRVSRDKAVRIRNESEQVRESFKVCVTNQVEIGGRMVMIVYGECEGKPEGPLLPNSLQKTKNAHVPDF